ncbi:hypothetical protein M413DRAFT_267349 [Hebeloma cylindrosporum]|uniref:Uncharacterized protein n=1 Tax=Hebeloma cylindrosporum TaxID=76867 RepID=A0A0C2YAY1_HEBCY|nr:hypothetical protein M413DRAFT_267349 [Hebeloma cylindrosporum h7]
MVWFMPVFDGTLRDWFTFNLQRDMGLLRGLCSIVHGAQSEDLGGSGNFLFSERCALWFARFWASVRYELGWLDMKLITRLRHILFALYTFMAISSRLVSLNINPRGSHARLYIWNVGCQHTLHFVSTHFDSSDEAVLGFDRRHPNLIDFHERTFII